MTTGTHTHTPKIINTFIIFAHTEGVADVVDKSAWKRHGGAVLYAARADIALPIVMAPS